MTYRNVLAIIALACLSTTVFARRAPQKEIVWGKSSNSKFEYKVETRSGKVSVYKAGDRDKLLWQAKIANFGVFFSKVVLADSGDYFLHNRSNHQVGKVTDIALQLYKQDGSSHDFKAEVFIDELVKTERPSSISPTYQWLREIKTASAEAFTVINAKGESKTIQLKDLKK